MDVTLPNGTVIKGVPEGATKDQVMQKAVASGLATPEDFGQTPQSGQESPGFMDRVKSFGQAALRSSPVAGMTDIPEAGRFIKEMVAGEGRATPEMDRLPEIQNSGLLAGEDKFRAGAITPALLTTTDPNEIVDIVTSNFPNVGVTYNKDGEGNPYPILVNNETGAAAMVNKPGLTGLDVMQMLSFGAAFTPATKGGASTAAGLGKLAAKGAGTQAVIEGAQTASGGEFNPENVAIAGALTPAAQVAGDKIVAPVLKSTGQKVTDLFTKQSPMKEQVKKIIQEGGADNSTAKYIIDGAGKVRADPLARNAIKQGYDEGLVAAIKGASAKDRAAMRKMLSIQRQAKNNARYAAENRPTDVVGDSMVARFRAVKSANREAGRRLDAIAKSLRGKDVDTADAVGQFLDDLENMGIQIGNDLAPRFTGSDIEGLAAPEQAIKRIIRRMSSGDQIDAYDVHRMKKFIDEQVTFGKQAEGLGGKVESVLKSLRRNLDQSLDETFPKYNEVNTKYADTTGALKSFQDVAGKKFDPFSDNAEKMAGTLSRRLLSNAQSRVPLLDSLNQMQSVAAKYGAKFEDDIVTQAMFADELSSMFGSPSRTSFEGGIEKGVSQALRGKAGITEMAIEKAAQGAQSMRGINDDNALKAMESLLMRDIRSRASAAN